MSVCLCVHASVYCIWLSAFLFQFYLLHPSWLLIDYKGLQSEVNFSGRWSFERTSQHYILSYCVSKCIWHIKVLHQAAATYHIWLIEVHVVLSYRKTTALSLQLWEDVRPVSLCLSLQKQNFLLCLTVPLWFLMLTEDHILLLQCWGRNWTAKRV